MDLFLCTPVFNRKEKDRRRDQSLDIESRVPRAIEDLRRWTSAEALGDVTVAPDGTARILNETVPEDQVDHKLPSPEEQLQAIALKFPAEIVAVDVSGKNFHRMSIRRKSMQQATSGQDGQETVKRRSRPRRPRGKRRNTIAGTDQKEIRQAAGEGDATTEVEDSQSSQSPRAHRSASTDLLRTTINNKESTIEKKSHFNTIKAWGMSRLKLISPKSSNQQSQSSLYHPPSQRQSTVIEASPNSSDPGRSVDSEEIQIRQRDDPIPTNSSNRRSKRDSKLLSHERKPSSSSSSGKSTSSLPAPPPPPVQRQSSSSVKLRDSAAQRRERRKGVRGDEQPHSSSGNWSASSESGRASIGSETTTNPPRSTTTASVGTSSTSLCHIRRLKGRDTSASSSVTSEGTLTPDIIQDIAVVPFSDDGETSSVYSCDTEGYYTSFHVDSGLKTLREEDPLPASPLTKSVEIHSDPTSPLAENEYELYGRGSTSTTTSSAGTVCTTLLAPPPPERKSSLTVEAMVHNQKQNGGESPDSGHNTSSSPVESASSPACTGRSCSEFEYSESSDLEGCERIERIRSKTAINTSRIPSMCVITPPGSDDEHHHNHHQNKDKSIDQNQRKSKIEVGSVLMSATVGTSKMEVINGQDKNLYATVQTVTTPQPTSVVSADKNIKISPLSGVLGKLRGVLPGKKHQQKPNNQDVIENNQVDDSGDYVTIADVRNNNDRHGFTPIKSSNATYADLFQKDAEYVSLSELPKKPDSSLERKRQGARVTLDSEGKVVYSSDSLKRRKAAHTTFIPGPFVKENPSPTTSPLLRRAQVTPRAVTKASIPSLKSAGPDSIDGKPYLEGVQTIQNQQQASKFIIRAAKSPDRAASPDCVRTPATVVAPTTNSASLNPIPKARGAYVNVQGEEENVSSAIQQTDSVSNLPNFQNSPTCLSSPEVQRFHGEDKNPSRYHIDQNSQFIETNPQQYYQQDIISNHQKPFNSIGYLQKIPLPNTQFDQYYRNSGLSQKLQYPTATGVHNNPIVNQLNNSWEHSGNKQFYTLPNRKSPQRDTSSETVRSVTPDITRGLARPTFNSMHILARHGLPKAQGTAEKVIVPQQRPQGIPNNQMVANNSNFSNQNSRFITSNATRQPELQHNIQVDAKKRFASPLGFSALGYRSFATPIPETLPSLPISPIAPVTSTNGFKSSTPTGRVPTVAERLALQASRYGSPNPVLISSSGRHTPVIDEKGVIGNGGKSIQNNFILSASRSTMSNEELFAAIHKSKKRLNIKDDTDSLSPASSCGSLTSNVIGTRHSWSPESQKTPEIPKTVLSPTSTSRLDFKRLLLQQSVKAGPTRVSAAEQLKLTRNQVQQENQQQPPKTSQQSPLNKVLSPRSAWRFQTPRTDVLSSTIIEDSAAEEKAMKPSPENSLNSKISPKKLNLEALKENNVHIEKSKNNSNDNKFIRLEKKDKEIENRLSSGRLAELGHNLQKCKQINNSIFNEKNENPIKAMENRRLSNQLARAQFLASSALPPVKIETDLFSKRFRARSESPQQNGQVSLQCENGVSRSPSAPALETAL